MNDSFGSFDSVEEMQHINVLVHLLLLCAVSCAPRLTHLDLTGVGYGMFTQLTMLELPRLRVLRMGEAGMEANLGWRYEAGRLEKLGRAFPTLTALDIGYANFSGGVSFASLQALRSGPGHRAPDLTDDVHRLRPSTYYLGEPRTNCDRSRCTAHCRQTRCSAWRGAPNLERLHWVVRSRMPTCSTSCAPARTLRSSICR